MRSLLQDITSHLSSEFIRLLGATIVDDADGTHLVIANERFPVIDGMPIPAIGYGPNLNHESFRNS